MSTPTIVSVGSIMCDLMSYVPRMPKAGESLLGCKIEMASGGKGANIAVATARLGATSAMIGKVGTDTPGLGMLDNFKENNVNADFVFKTKDSPTGTAIVIVEEGGENRIIVSGGANFLLTAEEVERAESLIQNCKVLAANLEVDLQASKLALQIAKKNGVKTLLNAAPAIANLDKEFYTLADIFCVNETEAEIVTGMAPEERNFDAIIAELLKRGCKVVIMTIGEKGALLATQEEPKGVVINAKALFQKTKVEIKVVDTTGAGDAFNGALVYFMAYHPGLPLKEQISRACYYAGLSVTKPGTQASYSWKQDLPAEFFN